MYSRDFLKMFLFIQRTLYNYSNYHYIQLSFLKMYFVILRRLYILHILLIGTAELS